MLAPVQDLQRFSRVESVATILHIDRNTTVPDAVGKVNGHSVRVGRELNLRTMLRAFFWPECSLSSP